MHSTGSYFKLRKLIQPCPFIYFLLRSFRFYLHYDEPLLKGIQLNFKVLNKEEKFPAGTVFRVTRSILLPRVTLVTCSFASLIVSAGLTERESESILEPFGSSRAPPKVGYPAASSLAFGSVSASNP